MVWIEDRTGAIVRGRAESVTASGLRVNLGDGPAFQAGDDVTLRICFRTGAPTIATTARVDWLLPGGGAVECGLVWTASAQERAALDVWLASAA